jgi:hypothetical protein
VCVCVFARAPPVSVGVALYYVERLDNTATQHFPDVGNAVWFMVVTFSTVGYGDVVPATTGGQLITTIGILCGVTFMAMPITIVGNEFSHVWDERQTTHIARSIQTGMLEAGLRPADIIKKFLDSDADGDGQMSIEEFISTLASLKMRLRLSEARRVFKVFDEDSSGTVSYQEFCHVVFPELDVEALSNPKEFAKLFRSRWTGTRFASDVPPAPPKRSRTSDPTLSLSVCFSSCARCARQVVSSASMFIRRPISSRPLQFESGCGDKYGCGDESSCGVAGSQKLGPHIVKECIEQCIGREWSA